MTKGAKPLGFRPGVRLLAAIALIALLLISSAHGQQSSVYSADKKKHHRSTSSISSSHGSTSSASSSTAISIPTKTHHDATPSPTSIPPHPSGDACDPLPLTLPPQELCDHILANCPPSGRLNYLHFYYCSSLGGDSDDHNGNDHHVTPTLTLARIIAMAILLTWMAFLFSCLGLVASDFFCPNLSTLASRLGMNESTAGVTFLALGNGSPDLFSTFSALSSGSGSLAIGELIGAASFIVSVVAGSMMLIEPFKVRPYPFLRDVGFFTVAVAMTMFYLLDGKLTLAESLLMVGLYLLYAATVIVGSWWEERRRRQRLLWERSRAAYASANTNGDGPYRDDGDSPDAQTTGPPSLLVTDELEDPTAPSQLESGRHLVLPGSASSPLKSPEYEPLPEAFDLDANAGDPFEVWASQQSLGSQPPRPVLPTSQSTSVQSSRRNSASQPMTPSLSASPTRVQRSGITLSQLKRTHSQSRSRGQNRAALRRTDASSEANDADADEGYITSSHHHMPRHSLLGAIEFRDVVRSLERGGGGSVVVRPGLQRSGTTSSRMANTSGGDTATSPSSRSRPRGMSTSQSQQHVAAVRDDAITGAAMSRDPSTFLPHPHRHHQHHHHSHAHTASMPNAMAASAPPNADAGVSGHPARGNAFTALPPPVIPAVEDPWREHRQGDACGPRNESGFSETFPTLPKLQVPPPRGHSPVPSITISAADETAQDSTSPHNALQSPQSAKSPRGQQEHSIWRSLRRALFPSFRHWKSKSHLGRALSIINAPPLMVLNLTLPVVDDEAEARAAAKAEKEERGGAVRLEGPESALLARRASGDNENDVDVDVDANGSSHETIVDLSTGERILKTESDESRRNRHRDRDLKVANALRRLPEEASPLTGPRSDHGPDPTAGDGSDCSSIDSAMSTSSTESHLPSADTKLFLTVAQCLLSPPFCVWASTDMTPSIAAASFACSFALAATVLLLSLRVRGKKNGSRASSHVPSWYHSASTLAILALSRCFMGFVVSIAWISTIVNEVVAILQALGLICGLSDAILGLTIFAAGNSLADLVADVTIARAGYPIMAISACFAGPLLNLLLGIGLSGSYLMSTSTVPDHKHTKHHKGHPYAATYPIHLSPTLISSGAGLLFVLICTLIVVPLNGFRLDRRTGWALIAAYVVVMTVNVTVEIFSGREKERHHGVVMA